MTTPLEQSLARIQTANRKIVGTGFLVNDQRILTCAHVVRDALNLKETPLDTPQSEIFLDFPFTAKDKCIQAHIICWHPQYDIAGLKLSASPPNKTEAIYLSDTNVDELKNHSFSTYGFPRGYDVGDWAEGVIKNKRADGLVKLEDIKITGIPIESGFSGAPVWDDTLNEVVGMIVTSDRQVRTTKVAFMIPIEMILNVWPELRSQKSNMTNKSESHEVPLSPTRICRKCLQDSYGGYESELRGICQDYFKPVSNNLKETDRLDDIIVKLILHCQATHQFQLLWGIIEREKPVQYKKYYPKWQKATGSIID